MKACACAWVLVAGMGAAAGVETGSHPNVVVAFGDSTTARRAGITVYADILARELPARGIPAQVFNAGQRANTTRKARERFQADVLDRDPDIVIVQFGINDAAIDVNRGVTTPRVSLAEYEANLRYFVEAARNAGAGVILMTPNPLRWTERLKEIYGRPPYDVTDPRGFSVPMEPYVAVVRRIAQEMKVELADVFAAFEENDGPPTDDLLLDGMHPNGRGHERVAAQLLTVIPTALRREREPRRP